MAAFKGEVHKSKVEEILKDYDFYFDRCLPPTKTVIYKDSHDKKITITWWYGKGKFLVQGKGVDGSSFVPCNADDFRSKIESRINPQQCGEKKEIIERNETSLKTQSSSETPKEEEMRRTEQWTTMAEKAVEFERKLVETGENQVEEVKNSAQKDTVCNILKRKASEESEEAVDNMRSLKKPKMTFIGKHNQQEVERIAKYYGFLFHFDKPKEKKVMFKNEEGQTLSWFVTNGKFMLQGTGVSDSKSHHLDKVIEMIENLKNREKEKKIQLEVKQELEKRIQLEVEEELMKPGEVSSYPEKRSRMVDKDMDTSSDRIKREQLTVEQNTIADDVLSGKNVFLTGPAGTGKSFLFKYIIQELTKLYGESGVAVCAPTGVAAINVNGRTIHSFAGVGLGEDDEEVLFQKVLSNSKARSNWRRTKVLMIDEVSMIGSVFFTKLANISRRLKELEGGGFLPFGGIQVVLCGDFFQLPPVELDSEAVGSFAFNSPAWKELDVKKCELTKIVRQNDPELIDCLNTVRGGNITQPIINRLDDCHILRKSLPEDGINPTQLMCTNSDVKDENNVQLEKLPGEEVVFEARDKIFDYPDQYSVEQLKKKYMDKKVEEKIHLKLDAQVVLIRNIDVPRKLVNGTRGVIVGFEEENLKSTRPIIKWDCGIEEPLDTQEFVYRNPHLGTICREQIPLKLAWALTVHKSQGMTLSRVQIKVDNAFENGQVYVALSRCVCLDGLWMTGASLSQQAVMAHPEVIGFYNQ